MGKIIALRLQEPARQALDLSAHLSEMPVSKLLNPLINEGVRTILGALIVHHIDRRLIFKRETFNDFSEMLVGSKTEGNAPASTDPSDLRQKVPRVMFDFFELMVELKAVQRINSALEGVTVEMDASYMDPVYLRGLCRKLGDTYISSGAPLDRLDYQKAGELFFKQMLLGFYRANARGTVKALTTQLYAHGDLLDRMSKELKDLYNERVKAEPLEAIVVSGARRKRGRPPLKRVQAALPQPGQAQSDRR